MRVGLMTAWNDRYLPLATIAAPIMQQYCDKHGYTFLRGEYHDHAGEQWRMSRGDLCKSAMFLKHADDFDVLMWLDVDSIITNHSVKIEDVLVRRKPIPYIEPELLCEYRRGREWLWTCNTDGPMSGFWIASTTPLVRAWCHRFAFACAYEYGGGDQYAMREVAKWPPYDSLVGGTNCEWGREAGHCFAPEIGAPKGLEHTITWQPGDWICTFPGLDIPRRMELMAKYATMVQA